MENKEQGQEQKPVKESESKFPNYKHPAEASNYGRYFEPVQSIPELLASRQ